MAFQWVVLKAPSKALKMVAKKDSSMVEQWVLKTVAMLVDWLGQ